MPEKEPADQDQREKIMKELSIDQIRLGVDVLDAKLKQPAAERKFADELILQKSRLVRLERQKVVKGITDEEYRVERTKIAYALEELTKIAQAGDFIENCGIAIEKE